MGKNILTISSNLTITLVRIEWLFIGLWEILGQGETFACGWGSSSPETPWITHRSCTIDWSLNDFWMRVCVMHESALSHMKQTVVRGRTHRDIYQQFPDCWYIVWFVDNQSYDNIIAVINQTLEEIFFLLESCSCC